MRLAFRPVRVGTGALLVLMLVSGLVMISGRAMALVEVPEQNPGILSIWTDDLDMDYTDMDPGEEAYIRLDVQLEDAEEGLLHLEVRKSGELATVTDGLELDVLRCDVPWTNVPSSVTFGVTPACADNPQVIMESTAADDYSVSSPFMNLNGIRRGTDIHLLARVGLPAAADPALVDDREAEFAFGLLSEGDELIDTAALPNSSAVPAALAVSGADVLALALFAGGAIGLGILVRACRARPGDQEVAA